MCIYKHRDTLGRGISIVEVVWGVVQIATSVGIRPRVVHEARFLCNAYAYGHYLLIIAHGHLCIYSSLMLPLLLPDINYLAPFNITYTIETIAS